jgi:23S rRNA G2069 N7-methylase RlmK/C1962 C5-methylase RlmI
MLALTVRSLSFRVVPEKGTVALLSSKVVAKSTKLAEVITVEGKARLFKDGNPLVYGNAVHSSSAVAAGEEVVVKDHHKNDIGRGFFNPHSMYRVRLIATKDDKDFDKPMSEIIKARITQALALRGALNLPRGDTDVYRLVNGEGDQLSGLMVDVLGSTVVIQSSAVWVELNRGIVEAAVRGAPELAGKEVLWRRADSRLTQDGWDLLEPKKTLTQDGFLEPAAALDAPSMSTVTENGIKYALCAETDQKTGFYCDQRDNRQMLRSLAADKSVLDLYCYTGGFSLNALQGGARSVTSVDSSLKALESLRLNIAQNEITCALDDAGMGPSAEPVSPPTTSHTDHQDRKTKPVSRLVKGDAERVMQELIAAGEGYDIVVCDPPKLAPRRTTLDRALKKYQRINSLAMRLVAPQGGLVLSCTCSAAVTQSGDFVPMLQQAAQSVGRTLSVLRVSGAAGDHPISPGYPEGRYLTAVLLYVR